MRKEQKAKAVLFGDSLGKKEKHCKLYKMFMAEMANTMATQTKLMKPMLADESGFKYGPAIVIVGNATVPENNTEVGSARLLKKEKVATRDPVVVGFWKLVIDNATGTAAGKVPDVNWMVKTPLA